MVKSWDWVDVAWSEFQLSPKETKDGQRRILPWSCTTTEECDEYVTPVSEKCSLESHWCAWASLSKTLLATGPVLSDMTSSQATTWQGGGGCELLQNEIWVEGFGLRGQKGPKNRCQNIRMYEERSGIELIRMMACKVSKAETQSETQVVRGRRWWNLHPNWSGLNEEFLTCSDNGCGPRHPGHPKALDLTLPCRRPGEMDVTKDIKR